MISRKKNSFIGDYFGSIVNRIPTKAPVAASLFDEHLFFRSSDRLLSVPSGI
jgi:hypothetical protein